MTLYGHANVLCSFKAELDFLKNSNYKTKIYHDKAMYP